MHLGATLVLVIALLSCWVGITEPKNRKARWIKKLDKYTGDMKNQMKILSDKIDRLYQDTCQKPDCPAGYMGHRHTCYKFIIGQGSRVKTWPQAKDYCQERGANLITINNKKQERFLHRYLEANFNHSPIEIYTGLIATNSQAEKPFDPLFLNDKFGNVKDSFRWTATKEAVVIPNKSNPQQPIANYHPTIMGDEAVQSKHLMEYRSCVALVWHPSSSYKSGRLTWNFEKCYQDSVFNFICEVRPPRTKCGQKRQSRSKRSVSIMKEVLDELGEGEEEEDNEDFDEENEFDFDDEIDEEEEEVGEEEGVEEGEQKDNPVESARLITTTVDVAPDE